MLLSKLLLATLKEIPSDAKIISHKLMLRAGLIRKISSGLYNYLPLGTRVLNKVTQIVREEMNNFGAQEVISPILLPKELLNISGRYKVFGDDMMRVIDRHNKEYALSPTNEESITDLVRQELKSYKELPLNLYQINTKFRDEIRPRFGVLRTREFIMKDAYSFHRDDKCLDEIYNLMFKAYKQIFKRCGLNTIAVDADSGAMGGQGSQEFMVRSEVGEETIFECKCRYIANAEKAYCAEDSLLSDSMLDKEIVDTPNSKTIEEVSQFMNTSPKAFIKTLIYKIDNRDFIMVLIRGDLDVNDVKLSNALGGKSVILADNDLIEQKLNIPVGFLGPVDCNISINILADNSIKNIVNGITGANIKDKHYKNININRDFIPNTVTDIRLVKEGDLCPRCNSNLMAFKGVEVGHIFKLGTKYSKAFEVKYLDEHGKDQIPTMGTYGIGVNRIPAAVIEHSHDDNGIIWPISIAPYEVIIVPISWTNKKQKETAVNIYNELLSKKIDVLLDDRDLRPGVKFKDADLIGIPIRINVGDKALAKGCVELKLRDEKTFNLVNITEAVDEIINIISERMSLLNRG